MANGFLEKLRAAAERNDSLLCVGLDPDPALMAIEDVYEFNRAIIDATTDLVCAYKPNLAFYDGMGERGHRALLETLRYIPDYIPVIVDSKRGDVEVAARFHARAMFDIWGFDAATVNAYGGRDAVQPFLDYRDKGVFVWCRSSNPGARDIQDLMVVSSDGEEPRPLYERIALLGREWTAENGNVGLVVGATYPEELSQVRSLCPDMPILIPGVGAQQGPLELAVSNGVDSSGGNAIINVSRSVLYASKDPKDFAERAYTVARDIRKHINSQLRFQFRVGVG